jgi:hypothetical protein
MSKTPPTRVEKLGISFKRTDEASTAKSGVIKIKDSHH